MMELFLLNSCLRIVTTCPGREAHELGYSALHTIETSFTLVPVFPVIIKEFSCLKKPWLL